MLITKAQLSMLHHLFFHSSAGKLYNLLPRVHLTDLSPGTAFLFEELDATCNTDHRFAHRLLYFVFGSKEQ